MPIYKLRRKSRLDSFQMELFTARLLPSEGLHRWVPALAKMSLWGILELWSYLQFVILLSASLNIGYIQILFHL